MVSCFGFAHSRQQRIIDSRGGAPRFLAVTQVCRSSTERRRRKRGRRAEEGDEEEEDEDLGTGRRRGTLVPGLEERGEGSSEEG